MCKQVHSKGVSIINGPYRVKTRIVYSIYAIRLSIDRSAIFILIVKFSMRGPTTRFKHQVMQLHYSPKLMQPEGRLGALFSIYECILYICVRAPARETTRLNGPDWKQKSLIRTPHYIATCFALRFPHRGPKG